MDLKRIGNGAHYSEVIDYNGILYLSGQVNVNTHEIRSQSKAIFAEIDRLLAENDSDMRHVFLHTDLIARVVYMTRYLTTTLYLLQT